jgi:hypothetical protein
MGGARDLEEAHGYPVPANVRVEMAGLSRISPRMSLTADQIVEETRQWPSEDIAKLVDRIVCAKHGGLPPERAIAWTEIAARRSAEIDSGKEKLVPGHEVSERIRRIVGR